MTTIRIGILAVQGAFVEHERMLRALGCECVELRKPSDIGGVDGLVLPGGESSVQGMLVRQLGLFEPLRREIVRGTPVLATCAGMILLAEKIRNDPNYRPSKPTAVAFALALELDLAETREMLMKAGFALSHSQRFDVIIEYFIRERVFDVLVVNETLFDFDQQLLGGS